MTTETKLKAIPITATNMSKFPIESFPCFRFVKPEWLEKLDGAPWLPEFVDKVSSLTWSRIGAKQPLCKAENLPTERHVAPER